MTTALIARDMFLGEVESARPRSAWGEAVEAMRGAGVDVPQILHLFNFKPEATRHLAAFTQEVMRGPSPLSPGIRELIAALTSSANTCDF
jgi:alkylhydroperoxidase family enzyme